MTTKRTGGRTTPKGTRPNHLRVLGPAETERSPADDLIESAASELLEGGDPIAAEFWASSVIALFDKMRLDAALERREVPPFEEIMLERCAERHDLHAAVVACALASVLPPPLDEAASEVVGELRRKVRDLPSWCGGVGASVPTRAWMASDVFGDQDSIAIGFRSEGGEREHSLVVLVDHNLSGQAKDAFIGANFEEVVGAWRVSPDPYISGREIPLDVAMFRLNDAMSASDRWNGDAELRSEQFDAHRALVWARLRRWGLLEVSPPAEEVPPEERAALVAGFLEAEEGRELVRALSRSGVDVEILVSQVVELRCAYEPQPLRFSPTVVEVLLCDLIPRKLLLDPSEALAMPEVLRALIRYGGVLTGLETRFVEDSIAAVAHFEPRYLEAMEDPGTFGPAKSVLAALQERGVDISDPDALRSALEDAPTLELPPRRSKAPRRRVAPSGEIADGLAATTVLQQFARLTEFYRDGRKLTATGMPTLADARALVAILGTRDEMETAIGERVFKTRSAAQLPELSFMVRWAVASGALRKVHGKLIATKSYANLSSRPLDQWMKALDALEGLGPLATWFEGARYRQGEEILDELAPTILHLLAEGPVPYEEMLDHVCALADEAYEWLGPYMSDPAHRRSAHDVDLSLLVRILSWAGLVERVGATTEPRLYAGEREVGGRLVMTAAGRWWIIGKS